MVFMIVTVNDHIRQAIRIELAKRNMKQAELAEKMGMSKQYLNRIMLGQIGKIPKTWEKLLDEFDLELVVRQKDNI